MFLELFKEINYVRENWTFLKFVPLPSAMIRICTTPSDPVNIPCTTQDNDKVKLEKNFDSQNKFSEKIENSEQFIDTEHKKIPPWK
jgi:hypothetical protein